MWALPNRAHLGACYDEELGDLGHGLARDWKCFEVVNFPTNHTGLDPKFLRLRFGHKGIGTVDVLNIQEKEHIVWIICRLLQVLQSHADFSDEGSIPIKV